MGIVLDPIKCCVSHPNEEILEELALHRLPEALAAQVEEHLLICPSCQDAVAETDRFVSALRVAARHPAPAIGPVHAAWRNALEALPNLSSTRNLAPILALIVLALVAVWKHPQEALTPVAVSLSSLRDATTSSPAPAEKPLQLNIDAPDLAPGRQYRLEVVDAAGRQVWRGGISEAGGKLTATLSKPLSNGVYWVRLYGADSELLREFGLSAK
jgi:hypothetical protein